MILRTLRQLAASVALGLAVLSFAGAPVTALAQEAPAADAPAAAAPAKAEAHSKSLWDTIKLGGPIMILIGLCSGVMVWLIVDGVIKSLSKNVFPPASVEKTRQFFRDGDYTGAYTFTKTHSSPFCDVVRAGIAYAPDGKNMTEEAMLSELDRVKAGFDSRISYLSVIGVCAPMIGLTGTVFGMMGAFDSMATDGAGDSAALSGHIGEVLVATASGLLIAIPAFVAYYLLRNSVTKRMHDLQELMSSLFRGMPYDELAGIQLGDEEIYAAKPAWSEAAAEAPAA